MLTQLIQIAKKFKFYVKIRRCGRFLESAIGDLWMNIDTKGLYVFSGEQGQNCDAFDYDTIAHVAIKKVISLTKPSNDDVVYDLGCGKGRVACHFAQQRVRKIVGIEISDLLCEIAKTNIQKLRNRRSPVEIINADVVTADLSDGTIFFLFNPFGERTLRSVLRNIAESHDVNKTIAIIIYVNPQFQHVFEEFSCFHILYDYQRTSGQRVVIYQNNINDVEKGFETSRKLGANNG